MLLSTGSQQLKPFNPMWDGWPCVWKYFLRQLCGCQQSR